MLNNLSTQQTLIRLILYSKNYLFILFIVLLLEIIASFFLIISITPLAEYIFDNNLSNPSYLTNIFLKFLNFFKIDTSFLVLSSIFIFGNFVKAIIETLTRYICLKIKYVLFENMSEEKLKVIFNTNWRFFGNADHGILMNSFQKELNNISDTISKIAQQLAYIVQLIVYFIIPLWINFELTLIALLVALFFRTPFLLLHKYSLKLGRKNTNTANIMIRKLYELFQSVRLIISHNKQNKTIEHYLKKVKNHSKAAVESQLFISATSILFQPFTILAAIIAVGLSGSSHENLPETTAILWSLMRAMPVLSKILQSNLNITNLLPSMEQVDHISNLANKFISNKGISKFNKVDNFLFFKNVYFAYEKRKFALENINLSIKENSITAFVGSSGSGKSTMIDLILGLQSPVKGEIFIDKTPYSKINLSLFREHIGYVPQDPQLFDMTIKQNLQWFDNKISNSEIITACKRSNAMEFIEKLPDKFETQAGNQGSSFSGGQRQRLTIARAFLQKPSLLILDEATSALDTKSNVHVHKTLEKLKDKITIIVISHKLETLKNTDYIYVFHNGKIVEEGKFHTLQKNEKSKFFKMLNEQQN